jgi:ribosomal protein S18 acetylase RimI-like enzyme
MSDPIAIRRIAADELPIVQQIANDTWPTAFAGVIERHQIEIMLGDIYDLDMLQNDMDALGHVFWVARYGHQDAGFVSSYKEDDVTWIKKLYILPSRQGLGIGRALMGTAKAVFAPQRALSLNVNNGNVKAIEFYKKYGFAVEREVPVKMGPFDFTDFVMTKVL